VRMRVGWLFVVLGGLLAACAAPANEPKINSVPATTSARIELPTAHILQQPVADQVVPFTPTPSPSILGATVSPPTAQPKQTVLSTPAVAADPTPIADIATASDDPAMLEALLVATINQVRVTNGLPPYRHSPELSSAARAHSCDLAAHGFISHESSDGRTLAQRLEGAIPPWEWPSENIAAGVIDPAATVAMWMDEPPDGWHRRNILDVDQREVGAGYCYVADDAIGNHHYWTADFSRRTTP
jgi:uncharacterized protein YkwD